MDVIAPGVSTRKLVSRVGIAVSVAAGLAHSEDYARGVSFEALNLVSCAGQKQALALVRQSGALEGRGEAAKTFGLSEDLAARVTVGREAKAAIVDRLAAACGGSPQPVTCVGSQCVRFRGNDCNTLATSCPTGLTCTEIGCSCDLSGVD